MKSLTAAALAVTAATALAAAASAQQGGRPLTATLTGAAEVPGPGDPDGSGTATIRINPGQGRVCYTITVTGITLPATAAHIHPGAPGQANPPVVNLGALGTSGTIEGCTENVSRELALQIMKNPGAFYVNVHTTDFRPGAIRGQLTQ